MFHSILTYCIDTFICITMYIHVVRCTCTVGAECIYCSNMVLAKPGFPVYIGQCVCAIQSLYFHSLIAIVIGSN